MNFKFFSSLIIILLFFPIFNINSIIYSKVYQVSEAICIPSLKEDGLYARAYIRTRYNVTNIDWGSINRNGNLFYLNIKIDFGELAFSLLEPGAIILFHDYKIGDIDIGEYSLEFYINDEKFDIRNFTINPSPIPIEEFEKTREIERNYLNAEHFWSKEGWIIKVSLFLNFAPQKIDWGRIEIYDDYTRIVNVTLDGKWLKVKDRIVMYPYEHNYTLGLLPKGQNSIHIILNDLLEYSLSYYFDSEIYRRTIIRTINATTTHTVIENGKTIIGTYTYRDITIETIYTTITIFLSTTTSEIEITTMPTTEETTMPTTQTILTTEETKLETKTIQTSIEETKKEKFEFEKYSIIFFLLFIVIIFTLLLYFILFKRKKI